MSHDDFPVFLCAFDLPEDLLERCVNVEVVQQPASLPQEPADEDRRRLYAEITTRIRVRLSMSITVHIVALIFTWFILTFSASLASSRPDLVGWLIR
jgi:hypothetical protein